METDESKDLTENNDDEGVAEAPDVFLCHNCLAQLPPNAHYCRKCNTPASAYAAWDPLMQIESRGDTYCKASSGKPRLISVIGIWLIFGPIGN